MPVLQSDLKSNFFHHALKHALPLPGEHADSAPDPPACVSVLQRKSGKRNSCMNRSFMPALWLIGFAIFFLTSASTLWASQVTLAWDANDPAPDGYRLYQRIEGSSYDYADPTWSGNGTTCTVSGLTEGNRYYFVIRAYDELDESGDSNEISFQPAATQPTTYAVTASASANGAISPSGTRTINAGGNITYTISANAGYQIADVRVDSVSVGGVSRYTFSNVRDTHAIAATFISADQPPVAVNDPPVADAGPTQTVTSGTQVVLNGAGSFDPEGSTLIYRWTQSSGATTILSATTARRPTFTAPQLAVGQSTLLAFELTVTDDQALTCTDTCIVQVNAILPADTDGDGVLDNQDAFPNDPSETVDTDHDSIGNNADTDDDDDGMPDDWEIQYGLNPLSNDSSQDMDGDGIPNLREYQSGSDPAQSNQPPSIPEIIYPADGAASVSATPTLKASNFSDPDAGDYHAKSEWRIKTESDQGIVLQTFREGRILKRLRVPRLILDGATTYACQVRYYDDHGLVSEWSSPVTFTTRCTKKSWCDSSVSADQGNVAPTDLNANGVPDANEPQAIRTIQALDGRTMIGISAEDGNSTMDGATAIVPDDEEEETQLQDVSTYDLFTYRILINEPGDESLVKILFSSGTKDRTEWIRPDTAGEWDDCTSEIYPQEDEATVIRIVQDGGPEDADGVANGIIIDIIGANAETASNDDIDHSLDSSDEPVNPTAAGGSSCFIGSLME